MCVRAQARACVCLQSFGGGLIYATGKIPHTDLPGGQPHYALSGGQAAPQGQRHAERLHGVEVAVRLPAAGVEVRE